MHEIHNSTYHGSIISIAAFAHAGPIALVLLGLGGLATVHFIAVFTVLPIAPSI